MIVVVVAAAAFQSSVDGSRIVILVVLAGTLKKRYSYNAAVIDNWLCFRRNVEPLHPPGGKSPTGTVDREGQF